VGDCGFQSLARRTGEVQALASLLNLEMRKASCGEGGPRARHQSYPVQDGGRGKFRRTGLRLSKERGNTWESARLC